MLLWFQDVAVGLV